MKILFTAILLCCLGSCHLKKITKINVQNNNDYATTIVITANNISHKIGPIASGQKVNSVMDWTDIEKKDGSFMIQLQKANGEVIHTYDHGYFTNGELYNHIDMEVQGLEVKIKIQN